MEYQCFLFTITTRILLILPGMVTAMTDKQRIQDDLWLYREKVTWEQAFNFCQADAASLAVPGPQEDSAIRSAINNGRDHVWVGQYSYTTPWMYPTGCFVSDKTSARMIENNDIFTCKRLCGESDIMLSIYNCLCVNEASDVSDRQKSSLCNTPCPGNTDEFCGGENVYQHYSTYTAIEDGQQDIYDCGMLEIHSSNQSFTVLPRHCNMVNPYLCEIYDNTTSGVTHYMPTKNDGSPEYLPHQTALQRCARNGSYLADPTKLNLTQFISGVPTQYWVGVRRRIHHVTSVNDQDLPKTQRNPKCLYMIKGSRGVSKDRTKDCSETALFLCRKQKKGSNFTTLPEEMTAVQAYMECKRLNSTLEVPRLDDIEAWNNTEGKGIWTGETLELAPWVFSIDCYGDIDGPTGHYKANNSGSTCLQHCANKTDVFVKENRCLCDLGNLQKSPDVTKCKRSCLTDGGTCGGSKAYTHYSHCFWSECKADSPIENNCMYFHLNRNRSTAACDEKHFPICKNGTGGGSLTLVVNRDSELKRMFWRDANKFCRDHGTVLADLRSDTGSLKGLWTRMNFSLPSPTFWIALNRAKATTKTLTEHSTSGNSTRCRFFERNGNEVKNNTKNCSQKAFASCRKVEKGSLPVTRPMTTTTRPMTTTTRPMTTTTVQTLFNLSSASNSTESDPDSTDNTIVMIVIPAVIVVITIVGAAVIVLWCNKRKKTRRKLQQPTRSDYDYTEVNDEQVSGPSNLQMQAVVNRTPQVSGSTLNVETHETRNMDEDNYDIMDKKSNLKQHSNVSQSGAYDLAFPAKDGVYNEIKAGRDETKKDSRDSFYATCQSCSTMDGNYDGFQKGKLTTEPENNYDHVCHKTD